MAVIDRISNAFKRLRKANPHEANELLRVGAAGWYIARKKYSDIYLWTVVNRIFAGMRSVNFTHEEVAGKNVVVADSLCEFFNTNVVSMLWQWWSKGYIVVRIIQDRQSYNFELVDDIHTDSDGGVEQPKMENWAVIYSDEYKISRLTAFRIIQNELDEIDALRSSENYLTLTFGALGIISGKEMPMVQEDKEEFLDEVKKKVGTTPDKYQFLVATGAISYTPIQVPIADLKFDEKEQRSLKLICDYFNVPFDLVSFSGASTYANMEQAVKLFYSNCIAANAEVLLELERYIVRRMTNYGENSKKFTFEIDNTSITTDERTLKMEQLSMAADTSTKMAAAGIDTTEFNEKIKFEAEK
ncbi:MAG: phage portal protein [Rikenellaceae bacterium]|nr:phage portal protein [Rikenellaceae bacterium]